MVHEWQHLVVQVRVDEHLHELQLEPLFKMLHHGGEGSLILAERVSTEARSQSNF